MTSGELFLYATLIVNGTFGRWLVHRRDLWDALGFAPTFEGVVALQWWCTFVGVIGWTALTIRVFNLTWPVAIILGMFAIGCLLEYERQRPRR